MYSKLLQISERLSKSTAATKKLEEDLLAQMALLEEETKVSSVTTSEVIELLKEIATESNIPIPNAIKAGWVKLELVAEVLAVISQQVKGQEPERVKGVRYRADVGGGKYQARVKIARGYEPALGVFDTVQEANAAQTAGLTMLQYLNRQGLLTFSKPEEASEPSTNKPGLEVVPSLNEEGRWELQDGSTHYSFDEALSLNINSLSTAKE
jgi:uncharacterized protein (UPF0147 family)